MGFNTFPCNPYPISTEELNKGNNDDLNTRVAALESDVSDLNSNKANQITIAQFFNAETAYTAGDLVYYNGLTYRCTNDHEGEWDADDFAATTIANELDSLKNGLTNAVKDVTSEFTLTVSTQEDVYFSVTDNPVSRTITIYITGNSTIGFPNGGVSISAPSKYVHNIPNGYILAASGMARDTNNVYAFVVAATSSDGAGLIINYSQSITALNLAFMLSYRYGNS